MHATYNINISFTILPQATHLTAGFPSSLNCYDFKTYRVAQRLGTSLQSRQDYRNT